MVRTYWLALALVFTGATSFSQQPAPQAAPPQPMKPGHSKHGAAFDSGLRSRPHLMPGIGSAPFPITTKNPEVQVYFNQANALMHNFWWEEAERSLRWCLKLEPNNAMVYWALALTGAGPVPPEGRYREFLNQAVKLKGNVTPRERAYIEAWEKAYAPGVKESDQVLKEALQKIVLAYPDDVEAKAQLAWGQPKPGTEYFTELVRDQIRKTAPLHPGATHSAIHTWDYFDPKRAIPSAQLYAKIAPRVGHALHMPGHIFSKVGMWHEAARSMDSATRTELRYLNERMALPHETWNFQHNRNYLSFIQEQLGMANAALQGARDLLAAPTDPQGDNLGGGGFVDQGREAFLRGCIKFERYDEVLAPGAVPYGLDPYSQLSKTYAECLAYAGKGEGAKAREQFVKFKDFAKKMLDSMPKMDQVGLQGQADPFAVDMKALEALVLLAEGKDSEGFKTLLAAYNLEIAARVIEPIAGDPPRSPWSVARLVGDYYLAKNDAKSAVDPYERALRYEPNCGFALSGLARAHHALGQMDKAREYAGRLEYVWSNADKGLKWLESVRALKLDAKPVAVTPEKERPYRPADLASFGPSNWQPFAAPKLECKDTSGKTVRLEDFRGKNVLLVFYLGDTCVHCMEQLTKINEKTADFGRLNTTILAVSSAAPTKNRDSLKLGPLGMRLLSDQNHENARRFASYDDFEDMELHSTILIDASGKVRWKRTGGDPFTNVDFLLRETARWTPVAK